MTTSTCWRCLARASSGGPLRSYPAHLSVLQFSTTAHHSYPAPNQKVSNQGKSTPQRGVKALFLKRKKNVNAAKGRPPAPGERKALRKRIVLSNTNALEVEGMQDFSVESMTDMRLRGQVVGIPGPVVDQLRVVEAFKVSQGWGLVRKPSMLVRKEMVEYGKLFEAMSGENSNKTIQRVLVGEKGSGKSMILLQAMTMAFLKKWVVINIPSAQDLTIGHTAYGPLPSTSPTQYVQKTYISNLLSSISRANAPLLSTLTLSTPPPSLPIPIQPNISLDRFALLGASDPEIAWPIFLALWTELTSPSTPEHPRPPILMGIDDLGHIMKPTAYMSADFKPIHAHNLVLVRWYIDYLSGAKQLPNGGLVLAATSESNHPFVPALKLKLAQLEARQNPTRPALPALTAPFLLATTSSPHADPIPQPDPFTNYDEHVMSCFADERIEVQRIKGLSREEARGLMEYWGKSGLLRQTVSEGLVGEKWTISGGGVVGELERGCLRMRI